MNNLVHSFETVTSTGLERPTIAEYWALDSIACGIVKPGTRTRRQFPGEEEVQAVLYSSHGNL